jgi:hypothetical protein
MRIYISILIVITACSFTPKSRHLANNYAFFYQTAVIKTHNVLNTVLKISNIYPTQEKPGIYLITTKDGSCKKQVFSFIENAMAKRSDIISNFNDKKNIVYETVATN